jgi:hypothetical protein
MDELILASKVVDGSVPERRWKIRMKQSRRVVHGVVSALLLAGSLFGGLWHTPDVRAAVASRGDPIFWIGPGASQCTCDSKVQMTVSVDGQAQYITYEIHGPLGTAVHAMHFTGGKLTGRESYTFVADQVSNQYVVVTTVISDGTVQVQVSEQLVTPSIAAAAAVPTTSSASSAPVTTTGYSNQDITTSRSAPSAPVSTTDGSDN